MSGKPDTGNPDTNKNQLRTRTKDNVNVITKPSSQKAPQEGEPRQAAAISPGALERVYGLDEKQIGRVDWLVRHQAEVLGRLEQNHRNYVKRAAEATRDQMDGLLDLALGEFKMLRHEKDFRNPPGYFQRIWDSLSEAQVRLRANSNAPVEQPTLRINDPGFKAAYDVLWNKFSRRDASVPPDETDASDLRERQRRNLIADLERRGFTVPPHIQRASLPEISAWLDEIESSRSPLPRNLSLP